MYETSNNASLIHKSKLNGPRTSAEFNTEINKLDIPI